MAAQQCPCCGLYTLRERRAGEICPLCYWTDDPAQSADPDRRQGANPLNLHEARENCRLYGVSEPRFFCYRREPTGEQRSGPQQPRTKETQHADT